MSGLLARWESHLASERRLSPHTVRAYVRAAERLLDETDATDWQAIAKLEAPALRAQLARRRADGKGQRRRRQGRWREARRAPSRAPRG